MGAADAGSREGAPPPLSDYMVPTALMVLPALLLAPNGKVDRKGLARARARAARRPGLRGSRTPAEEVLAGIWGRE